MPYRLKKRFWLFHIKKSIEKQTTKLRTPWKTLNNSSKVCGTSMDIMSNVTAKANTASLKVSSREGSWLRHSITFDLPSLAAFFLIVFKLKLTLFLLRYN